MPVSVKSNHDAYRSDPPSDFRCPLCKSAISGPTLQDALALVGPATMKGRILKALWNGSGLPVHTDLVFAAMFSDDPDGGPSYPITHN